MGDRRRVEEGPNFDEVKAAREGLLQPGDAAVLGIERKGRFRIHTRSIRAVSDLNYLADCLRRIPSYQIYSQSTFATECRTAPAPVLQAALCRGFRFYPAADIHCSVRKRV